MSKGLKWDRIKVFAMKQSTLLDYVLVSYLFKQFNLSDRNDIKRTRIAEIAY